MLPAASNPPAGRPNTAPGTTATGGPATQVPALTPLDGTLSKYTNVMKGWQKSQETAVEDTTFYTSVEIIPLVGYLSKFTNFLNGWQYRYFFLNPHQGVLEYHVSQSEAFGSAHKPRGILHLAGAVISPSGEDSYTFSVNAANGEVYKLRANDAKERQHWVSHLRMVTDHFTKQIAQEHPALRKPRSISTSMSNIGNKIKDAADQVQQKTAHTIAKHRSVGASHGPSGNKENYAEEAKEDAKGHSRPRTSSRASANKYSIQQQGVKRSHKSDCKELREVRETLVSADNYHAGLMNMLETLPHVPPTEQSAKGAEVSALDEEVLMLKSTSAAAMKCLDECYTILQQYQHRQYAALPPGAHIAWVQPRDSPMPSSGKQLSGDVSRSISNHSAESYDDQPAQEPVINPSDEVCDSSQYNEVDLGTVEKHKPVIMHLLSQLKLGMDLTRVTLPTFILEKRSLLEMYADFLAHSELFIAIPGGTTSRDRMIRVVKYYLTSFHCGKGQLAKKPYNPLVGETCQCSYYVSKSLELDEAFQQSGRTQVQSQSAPDSSTHFRIRYASEQVSHHPPVSAFYAECQEREICMNAHIWTKSKFMNMSIGVVNIGEGVITLTGHKERYVVTFPSAFARSILTTPWMELGGRCTITCDQTNLAASIVFHTKPMYGGQPHKVTAEVKDVGSGSVFCRAEGEWNGSLTFTSTTGEMSQRSEVIETTSYTGYKKYVRPMNMQEPLESRNLWKGVTAALLDNDITTATDRKTALEDWQRKKEKRRLDSDQTVKSALFRKSGDAYIYKNSLFGS